MTNHFPFKTLMALAVAIAAAGSCVSPAIGQAVPPAANVSALPANIQPGTPLAEVVKLAQSGVDAAVILSYIANCPSAFNLDADTIISLTDAGVTSDMVNAMIAHDKNLAAAAAPAATSAAPADNVDTAAPPTDVDVNYFNDTLTPYGQWVEVEGYGRCWRPTVVLYDSTWQPYCDRGHWVYTDCGWYWDSNYSWGVTFHYGRWFHDARFGWCWWPDTVWAPSWVTWRSSDDYCGWAPLPPFAVYRPGIGFYYRGASVAVGFDFGLPASCFTFVPVGHFCDPHPRSFRAPQNQISLVFNRTRIINNFGANNRTIVNNGVSVTVIGAAMRRPIQPVRVGTLPHAGNQGWRGGDLNQNPHRSGVNVPVSPAAPHAGGTEVRREPAPQNNGGQRNVHPNSDTGTGHRPPFVQPAQPVNRSGDAGTPGHSQQNPATPGSRQEQRQDQHQSGFNGRNFNSSLSQNATAPAVDHSRNVLPAGGNDRLQNHEAAPAVNLAPAAGERSQHAEVRQNSSQSAPRSVVPAVPAQSANASGKAQGNSDKLQDWQNRSH